MNEDVDHDQRFKEMIRECFGDFLALFFPRFVGRLDLSAVEWHDKELLPNPPAGDKHVLDLVAKLRTTEPTADGAECGERWVVIHIEIESADRTTRIEDRLGGYYRHLRDRTGLPVLPVVLYLKVGLDGTGKRTVTETFLGEEVDRLTYNYIGLPGLTAADFIDGDNMLGVALSALMKVPKGEAVEFGLKAMRRLGAAAITDHRKFLLGDCVQAYLDVDEAEQKRFRGIILANATGRVAPMNKTLYDIALERNLETGQTRALRSAVVALIEAKFGPVPAELAASVEATADRDQLQRWVIVAGTVGSLAEFRAATGI